MSDSYDDYEIKIQLAEHAWEQALEEKQEPVAWITDGGKGELWWYRSSKFDEEGNVIGPNPDDIPLYAAPPKKQWVGLTEEEIEHIADSEWEEAFVRMIEAKLREKNKW